jgi:Flp pilus assembly protein TadG
VSRARERGAAAVEFAIILPVLMLLILGSMDWGYWFFVQQLVTNSAREGARAGSITHPKTDIAGAIQNAEDTAESYLEAAGLTGTGTAATATATTAEVTVIVTYPVGSLTGFLDVIVPANAYAKSVMRR